MKIVTGTDMASIDKHAIEEMGVPGPVLMENAARAVCRAFVYALQKGEKPAVTVISGSGNNGGDGFCTARILSCWGFRVFPVHVGRIQSLKSDASLNYRLLKEYGQEIISITSESDLERLDEVLKNSDWLIDALFGTGLSRQIIGTAGKVIERCRKFKGNILAIDIPSGINSDTGEIMGVVLPANLTVTFGLPKWGHFLFPGAGNVGKLVVADIGFPPEMLENDSIRGNLTTAEYVRKHLPTRPLNAHKGNCGKLTVIAGCRHLLGAAILTCKSALRTGAGYVTLLLPNYLEPLSKIAIPDIVTMGLTDMEGGFITTKAVDTALGHTRDNDAVALGPGMGRAPSTRDFVIDFLEENKLPVVIDADGLNSLAMHNDLKRDPDVPWIMTPHPGEAAKLLNRPIKKVLDDVVGTARELVEKYKAVIVMKGANTLIMDTDSKIFVNPTGNPGMATMGMGDILTGIISTLLAQRVSPFIAAVSGVYIHGLAGDLAAKDLRQESIIASDLVIKIPEALDLIKRAEVTERIKMLR
ncbi:MAG: NAD(P)H-hydrate dehydratase [Candidatus Eremiobacteraeota bacterium]|nr:NAD(P)H-hydrate dehydratase [Candidatus Eremiobacteraeota bacterium]